MPGPVECKIYVGDLDSTASKQELEDIFSYYGRLRNVWVARNPPGFAFVEFEDGRDAEDAVRGLDGSSHFSKICGRRARIEMSTGKSRNRYRGPPPRQGRPFNPADKCYQCGVPGHYARDCNRYQSRRSRSRSRSPRRRSYSRSRSRSRGRGGRSYSRERSRSASRGGGGGGGGGGGAAPPAAGGRSRSRENRSGSRSRVRDRPRSASRSRSEPRRDEDDY